MFPAGDWLSPAIHNLIRRRVGKMEEQVKEYLENLLPLQRGKTAKVLDALVKTDGFGCLTRGDFVMQAVKKGYIPYCLRNVTVGFKKVNMELIPTIKKRIYILKAPEGTFIEVTKTEYDLAEYLSAPEITDEQFNKLMGRGSEK